jgi:hypothetical protein
MEPTTCYTPTREYSSSAAIKKKTSNFVWMVVLYKGKSYVAIVIV